MFEENKPFVIASLDKSLKILEVFIEEQRTQGAKEISDRLKMNFSATNICGKSWFCLPVPFLESWEEVLMQKCSQ